MPAADKLTVMQSQLGRVRALGAGRSGTLHWWAQRLTAMALLPLTVWFVIDALRLVGLPRDVVAHWAAHPINAALLAALVLASLHHAQLGLRVVVEDYVHAERTRLALVLLIQGAAAILCLIALIAIARLATTP
jgi:succinate dehydrogenase / fumarate reductase membrane anchor subunit